MDINVDKKYCEHNFQRFLAQTEVDFDKFRQKVLGIIGNQGLDVLYCIMLQHKGYAF